MSPSNKDKLPERLRIYDFEEKDTGVYIEPTSTTDPRGIDSITLGIAIGLPENKTKKNTENTQQQ